MSGRVPHIESSHDLASAETAQTFALFFDDLWAACEMQAIPISGYGHESATGQYEVNFRPGEPLAQADAVFRFKRLAREFALRHGCLATFMAKPYANEPGTGMHWHVSLSDRSDRSGHNAFTAEDGSAHPRLAHFIGGWQASAPAAMAIPQSEPAKRRVEHRLPGGDANPYLTLALLLGTGLIGMQQAMEPRPARDSTDANSASAPLPQALDEALSALANCPLSCAVLGTEFIGLYTMVKRHELAEQAADADFALRHLLVRS